MHAAGKILFALIKNIMQRTKIAKKDICGSSVLDPKALTANRVTTKKPSLKARSIKTLRAPGKVAKETRKLDKTSIENLKLCSDLEQLMWEQ